MPLSGAALRSSLPLMAAAFGLAVVVYPTVAHAQSLRGSPASVSLQHRRAELNGFTFLRTPAQVESLVDDGRLVPVTGNSDYTLNDVSFEVARPSVKLFIDRLSQEYREVCHEPLVVTSLTRPLSDQPPNASPLSVHPAGMAVDLRRPADSHCRAWLESTLLQLEAKRVVEATLEHNPPHFHVAVFARSYLAYVASLTGQSAVEVRTASLAQSPYTVRRSDTLWNIASRYGTTPTELRAANHLRRSIIHPGDVLRIPAESQGGS